MSTTTTNFGLVKPALTDTPDITAMNPNWDTIDNQLKMAETARGAQVNKDGSVAMSYLTVGSRKANSAVGTNSVSEGINTTASGNYSHAEGNNTIASGSESHSEGNTTIACGVGSHSEGGYTLAGALTDGITIVSYTTPGYYQYSNIVLKAPASFDPNAKYILVNEYNRNNEYHGAFKLDIESCVKNDDGSYNLSISGTYTIAGLENIFGPTISTYEKYNHSEGRETIAYGSYSHAEGFMNVAYGEASHAEGYGSYAAKLGSHAEGCSCAGADYSHTEGYETLSTGRYSHAEGSNTTSSGTCSHAEGLFTSSSGTCSHAEGNYTSATGNYSHCEGQYSSAAGAYSHTVGCNSTASGDYSFVHGQYMQAKYSQTAIGQYGTISTSSDTSYSAASEAFMIGNGTSTTARGLAFKVLFNGATYADAAYNSTGADYAEYFEWLDGNPNSEDRVGYFVTLDGDKIRKATSSDKYILGIVSATPAIIGDSYEAWQEKYITDEWGRIQYEMVTIPERKEIINDVENIIPEHSDYIPKYNPDWDPEKDYVSREHRTDWSAVGMVGKLLAHDDGTCVAGKRCAVNDDGMATLNENGDFYVMNRVSDTIVKVLLK